MTSMVAAGVRCTIAVFAAASTLWGQARAGPPAAEAPLLEPGMPVQREISPGQVHSFRIALNAERYAEAVVAQQGIDVTIALRATDGALVMEVDGAKGTQGSEAVWTVTGAGDDHLLVLEVRAPAAEVESARYEVTLFEPRGPTAQDRRRVEATRAVADAGRLSREGSAESRKAAALKYEESLSSWRAAGDRLGEARALADLADLRVALGDPRSALGHATGALDLARALGDRALEGRLLSGLGSIHHFLGHASDAVGSLEQALVLQQGAGDLRGQAATLIALGEVHAFAGEIPRALDLDERARELWRRLGDRHGEAVTLHNIGLKQKMLGDYQKALEMYGQALSVHQELGDRSDLANTHNSIGKVYEALGDQETALAELELALPLWRSVGDRRGETFTLNNLGMLHLSLGENQKALELNQQALDLSRSMGARDLEATALDNLGVASLARGQAETALAHHQQALALRRASGDRRSETWTLFKLGAVFEALGQEEQAAEHYAQALALQQAIQERLRQVWTLAALARLDRARGDLDLARGRIESALDIAESLRAGVASPDLRASYQTYNQGLYAFYVGLLMQLHRAHPGDGFDGLALAAAERGRARTFLDLLREARVNIREGADASLLARERDLAQRLNAKELQRMRLLGGKSNEERRAALEQELEAVLGEHRQVQAEIRARNPHYAGLTQPQPVGCAAIQALLDADTLLLEYALGEERSFVWAVTRSSLASYELPPRAQIEEAARLFYDAVTRSHLRAVRGQADVAADALSRQILGPVAEQLGTKRLVVVSDGILQYIPFGALPRPSGPAAGSEPLIVRHEVVSLPSASSLGELRADRKTRPRPSKLVAVLSDPVFQARDRRVRRMSGSATTPAEGPADKDLSRALLELDLARLPRLPLSRQEAEAIVALAPADQTLKALDFEASRATATDSALAQYRIVHLAAHGLLNSRHPELSGIVLSLVDEQGRPQDGFLRLHDIYNLRFDADLVVLSACQTALGKEVRGEGLIGLTRGFMYAGAPGVVASLWSVRDAATAELMQRFYRAMLRDGQRPTAALREAQVSMWKDPRWRAPYYWAAFVMQGDWR